MSFNYDTLSLTNTLEISRGNTSGVAINRTTNTLYRITEGAFGTLESINLQNGDITKTVGLYLHDLLN
jgi:hypothetical protein